MLMNFLKVFVICLFFNSNMLYAFPHILTMDHVRKEKHQMLGVFWGGTHLQNNNFFTYGFEYHRIIKFPFGFSFIGEDMFNDREHLHESALIGLVTLNVLKNFIISTGPGVQLIQGESSNLLGRVSGGFIFQVGQDIEIIPSIDYNTVNHGPSSYIYGITMGKQF